MKFYAILDKSCGERGVITDSSSKFLVISKDKVYLLELCEGMNKKFGNHFSVIEVGIGEITKHD